MNWSLITYWAFWALFVLYLAYTIRRGRVLLRLSKENTVAIQENTAALQELIALNRQHLEKQIQGHP